MVLVQRILLCILLVVFMMQVGLAAPNKLALDLDNVNEWPMKTVSLGRTLLLSDSPEIVTEPGIMYQDTVQGDVRLFFHHVNGTSVPQKVVVLLQAAGSEPATVTVTQFGLGGPGYDYLAVGKTAQENYLNGGVLYLVDVPLKGAALLDEKMMRQVVSPNQLVNGIYDFKVDNPVKVTVMMLPVNASVETYLKKARVLPTDQVKLRGTFADGDRLVMPNKIYSNSDDGAVAITLADVSEYISGIDKTDGSTVINYGNYGVLYKLYIPSTFGGKFAIYLNPQGGEYAGAIGLKYKYQEEDPVLTPPDRIFFGAKTTEDYSFIGSFEGGQSLWLTFTPPGASNLPVRLFLLPWGGE